MKFEDKATFATPARSRGATDPVSRPPSQSLRKVLVTTLVPDQKTAWTKARADVVRMAEEQGYGVLTLPAGGSPADWMKFLAALGRHVGPGDHLLLEYPFAQRKRAYMLYLFCRLRGVRLYGILHDLDSLRFDDSPPERELVILQLFDGLVSHNAAMTRWLRAAGLTQPIVDLNLFDYRAQVQRPWNARELAWPLRVVCAGNLSYTKARYLYDPCLADLKNVELSLFGAFFEPGRMPPSTVHYRGVFDPDTPALDDAYHFGLVWDGTSADGVEGSYGRYMRYNNPHKLSLYVALGLPVIVWREAAIASFVTHHGIGLTIDRLCELDTLGTRVDARAYRDMASRAGALGTLAREGEFMRLALAELLAADRRRS